MSSTCSGQVAALELVIGEQVDHPGHVQCAEFSVGVPLQGGFSLWGFDQTAVLLRTLLDHALGGMSGGANNTG